MKKTLSFILTLLIITSLFTPTYAADKVTLYAPDGRTIVVYSYQVQSYLNVGWFKTYDEVTQKLYSLDGRQITVYKSQVNAFLKVGWYKTYAEVTQKLYSYDGRQITVYKAEVDDYLKVGWYKNYEDVTTKLYAPDGREITVYNYQVQGFLASGWSRKSNPKAHIIKAYKNAMDYTYDANSYTLYDIDKNGIPELILGCTPEYIAAPGSQVKIFTYFNGSAAQLANRNYFIDMYTYNQKLYFFHADGGSGAIRYLNYNTNDYDPRSVYVEISYAGDSYRDGNGNLISESTYQQMLSKLTPVTFFDVNDYSLLYQIK